MAFSRVLRYAKLSEAEEVDFKILFIQSLLSGFGASFFFVVVNTFFLKKTSIASLPPGYILSGIFGFFLIAVYKKWQKKFGVISAYSIGYVMYCIVGILLFIGQKLCPDTSLLTTVIAYVGFVVVLPFGSMQVLGFSTVCLRVFNISQSKRLLALIGTGEVIASIVAYLIIPFLTRWMGGAAPLLILSAAANIMAIIPLRRVYRNNKEKLDAIAFKPNQAKMNVAFFRNDKFFMLIAIVTIFSVSAVYFADYAYLLSVRYIHNESGYEIASIVAIIFSLIKSGELVFSLLSGKILNSYGMKTALIVLPVLLAFSSLMGSVFGIVFFEIPFFVVCFLLFNKWSERAVRKGVTIPAMKVLYQVVEPDNRARLQTAIEGTLSQYATIAAGLFLFAFSLIFKNRDILFFLRSISFVYLVVFAGWGWFMYRLFGTYKDKIHDFIKNIDHNKNSAVVTDIGEVVDIEKDTAVTETYGSVVTNAMDYADKLNAIIPEEYIAFYNPQLKSIFTGKDSSLHQMKRTYYNNENFFSRLLIIWYMRNHNYSEKINFIKEYYDISALLLKLEMLAMLNSNDNKVQAEDVFFFTNLCKDTSGEIMWTESAINDLAGNIQPALKDALYNQVSILHNVLFELLKVLYDKTSIVSVQGIINSKDRSLENRLFAVELLDNVLEPEMKKIIVPLFEDVSFATKKEKLQKILLIYHLPVEARLKEILMTNFMIVSPYIKQLALQEYYSLTGDASILAAFAASNLENLNATARMLMDDLNEHTFASKTNAVEKMKLSSLIDPSSLSYFINWGLFTNAKKKPGVVQNEYTDKHTYQFNDKFISSMNDNGSKLLLDTFGLSLMFKINKQ